MVFIGTAPYLAAIPSLDPSTILVRRYPKPFLVVGYHEFGGPAEYAGGPKFDIHGLNIAPQTFRRQLESMEAGGFYPVDMRDIVLGSVRIPAKKTPIVLTFDDGRATQFKYLKNGSIDPACAVGILLAFHKRHPDWPLRGSFYLITGSDANGVPFDQEGLEGKKIRQLLEWGFEVGNHTNTHPSFKNLKASQITAELAGCQAYLASIVPGIRVDTEALPYGDWPQKRHTLQALIAGGKGKGKYRYSAVLLFSGGFVPSPCSSRFDPFRIPRVAPSPGNVEKLIGSNQ